MNIVLIGYRGTGKSTIGRLLAERLGRPFVDTDALIVERAGKTIREIFEAGGEAAFRELEAAVVEEVSARDGLVIAAGGGVILRAENGTALRRGGKVIWLTARAEVLHARIQADAMTNASRPNLTAAGGLEEVRTLLAARTRHYAAAADATVDVEVMDARVAATWIVERVLPGLEFTG